MEKLTNSEGQIPDYEGPFCSPKPLKVIHITSPQLFALPCLAFLVEIPKIAVS